MNKKIDHLIQKLKKELGLFLSISFGIFLFVLFFQPFPLVNSDFNNKLIIVAGLGAIVFIFIVLIRTIITHLVQKGSQDKDESALPSSLSGFAIFILSVVAFEFYLRYIGFVSITFFITVKVLLICLAPVVILAIYDTFNELKEQNRVLADEKKMMKQKLEDYQEDLLNKSIEFSADNNSEKFSLIVGEVAFIKSADNYVEIVYKEEDTFKKKLIRNTLRNIEIQIRQYSNFLRCHRICIINLYYVEKLTRSANGYFLKIKGIDEEIPVSRKYLLNIQAAI